MESKRHMNSLSALAATQLLESTINDLKIKPELLSPELVIGRYEYHLRRLDLEDLFAFCMSNNSKFFDRALLVFHFVFDGCTYDKSKIVWTWRAKIKSLKNHEIQVAISSSADDEGM